MRGWRFNEETGSWEPPPTHVHPSSSSGKDTLGGFQRANLAAALTNSQLDRVTGVPVSETMAFPGSVVGITVASGDARTAGSATFTVFKNGSSVGLSAALDATNTQYAYATQATGLDTFVAGDRLDIRVTTTADWAPTTADVNASVIVEFS